MPSILGLCKDFDVSLGSDGSPFIYYAKNENVKGSRKNIPDSQRETKGGMWWPICGQFFSENDNGAELFCQRLGYLHGSIDHSKISDIDEDKLTIPMDAFMIGKCSENDTNLLKCNDKCNLRDIGGSCEKESCSAGKGKRVKINCHERKEQFKTENSCRSKCLA